MKRTVFASILTFILASGPTFFLYSQYAPATKSAVVATVDSLFEAMRQGDSSLVHRLFAPGARLQTTFVNRDGSSRLVTGNLHRFLNAVASSDPGQLDERIWSYDVRLDDPLATVWTEYTLFMEGELSHCGVNAFQLFRSDAGWRITQITDTRRQGNCRTRPPRESAAIDSLLDDWHRAAATADEERFFGSMTSDGIYLGTDPSERWTRDEMRDWAAEYFQRDTAWAFTPRTRKIHLSANRQMAWFDELLDTWMGACRGSGVLRKTSDGWKIAHYNLALTVPNEKMNQVIDVIGKQSGND